LSKSAKSNTKKEDKTIRAKMKVLPMLSSEFFVSN
jgi:hypothetical protein